jgi:uncharacterized membrane protein
LTNHLLFELSLVWQMFPKACSSSSAAAALPMAAAFEFPLWLLIYC